MLRAEWTIFRKSHVFLIGIVVAVLATILLGLRAVSGIQLVAVCGSSPGVSVPCSPANPKPTSDLAVGPDSETVTDKFYFVYQPLVGNGSITARLTSMTGEFAYFPPNANPNVPSIILKPGVEPWGAPIKLCRFRISPGC